MLYPQVNKHREKIDLSDLWKFALDYKKIGEGKGWFRGFKKFVYVAVPASWNEQILEEGFSDVNIKNYQGDVWYHRSFYVPDGWREKNIWLRVGAAYYRAKVWVNGHLLGEHEGGFLPFQFEVTDKVKIGEENSIVIMVNNELGLNTIPQGRPFNRVVSTWPPTTFDWFPYSGIHRPVILYTTARSHVKDIVVKTDINGKTGIIDYQVTVKCKKADSIVVSIIETGIKQFKKSGSGSLEGRIHIEKARFWYPEAPFLYNFKVEVIQGNKTVDEYIMPIGVRTIKIKANKLLLNEKPIFLRGVCKHEDFPIHGKGLNLPLLIKDYSLLKWLGANTVRCTHYPYAEEMLQLADKNGILLMDEVPAFNLLGDHLNNALKATHKKMLKELISRDRNHPSIISWFVANEPYYTDGSNINIKPSRKVSAYFRDICRYVKQLDERPVTIAMATNRDECLLRYCDIASVNRYYGWYHYPGRIEEGCRELSKKLDQLYRKLKKPILLSEFGADALSGAHGNPPEMFTEEFQTEFLTRTMKMIESKPYIIGELIWCFADFKTPQSSFRMIFNRKGIFTRDRQPKMAAHKVREHWRRMKK